MPPLRTLLLVEDSPLTRYMIRRMLEQHSEYTVLEAADGQEALHLLDSHAVDVVLSDLHMLPMDGHVLRESIRGRADLAHLPFIMMTAQHCPDSIRRTVGDQGSHYLPKPFSREQLYEILAQTATRQAA